MSKELTEAWKAGKIEKSQRYWIKYPISLGFVPAILGEKNQFYLDGNFYDTDCDIKVLAICDYDELQRLQKDLENAHWYQTVQNEDIAKLRTLLKGCKHSVFKIYDRLRFSDENEITPADLINAVDEIKPMLWGILNSINAALSESKEK